MNELHKNLHSIRLSDHWCRYEDERIQCVVGGFPNPDGPIPGNVDSRRTLYWNPNVVTDSTGTANVEFYNNGISDRFRISAAGITASGVPYVLDQNW